MSVNCSAFTHTLVFFCCVLVQLLWWRWPFEYVLLACPPACYRCAGSDDFTLFLWEPSTQKQPLARMTGHMQLINQVCIVWLLGRVPLHGSVVGYTPVPVRCLTLQVTFSPDGRWILSASFDKSGV